MRDSCRCCELWARVRIAASSTDECENEPRVQFWLGRISDFGNDHLSGRRGIGPAPYVELEPNSQREERQPPEVELMLFAVRKPGIEPACRRLVRVVHQRAEGEVVHRPCNEVGSAVVSRESERPVESLVCAGIPEQLSGRHRDRGVDPGLDVAGLCRQLHRSLSPGIHSGGVAAVRRKECHRVARLGKHRTLGSPFEYRDRLGGRVLGLREKPATCQMGHEPAESARLA